MSIGGPCVHAAPRQRLLSATAAEFLALSESRRSKWCRTATDSTIDRFSAATSSTAREMISALMSVSVHPPVHPSAIASENTVFPAFRTAGTLLPKLDVEGSSPFARSVFTLAVPSMATAGEKWCQPPNLGKMPASPFLVAGTFSVLAGWAAEQCLCFPS